MHNKPGQIFSGDEHKKIFEMHGVTSFEIHWFLLSCGTSHPHHFFIFTQPQCHNSQNRYNVINTNQCNSSNSPCTTIIIQRSAPMSPDIIVLVMMMAITILLICKILMDSRDLRYPQPYPLPGIFPTTLPEPYPKSKSSTRQSLPPTPSKLLLPGYSPPLLPSWLAG